MIAPKYTALTLDRHAVSVVAAFCLSTSTVCAQDTTLMRKTWDYFVDRCSFAYSDPEQYVSDITSRRSPSLGNVAISLDGTIVWAGTTGSELHDTYKSATVANHREQTCYVMGYFDSTPVSPSEMNADFLKYMATHPELVVTGSGNPKFSGSTPIEPETYRYAVLGALPEQIVTKVIIGLWVIEIFSAHSDTRE